VDARPDLQAVLADVMDEFAGQGGNQLSLGKASVGNDPHTDDFILDHHLEVLTAWKQHILAKMRWIHYLSLLSLLRIPG